MLAMSGEFILQGKVMWSFDHEIGAFSTTQKMLTGLSGIGGPLHAHNGNIALTSEQIIIEGLENDEDLTIYLTAINELYLGFDDVYTVYSVKNAGLFWQPLRLEYFSNSYQTKTIYLIIEYNGLYAHNKKWYECLISMLQ